MKTTKTEHGKSGWLHIDGQRIPIESWAMEYEADGQQWDSEDKTRRMDGGIHWLRNKSRPAWISNFSPRLSRNARRLLRKKGRP